MVDFKVLNSWWRTFCGWVVIIQGCHGIDCGFNPSLCPSNGCSWVLTVGNPYCFIKDKALYMAVCSHERHKVPLRSFEESRAQCPSQASATDFSGNKVMWKCSRLRLQDWIHKKELKIASTHTTANQFTLWACIYELALYKNSAIIITQE